MFKLKYFKIEFKHLLTFVSALGMVAGFIVALFSKKKAAACVAFFASFAGLVAGLGMESGVVPTPSCCDGLEVELFGDDDDEDLDEYDDGEDEEGEEDAEGEEEAEDAPEEAPAEEPAE